MYNYKKCLITFVETSIAQHYFSDDDLIEGAKNLTVYTRNVYTSLDWLKDTLLFFNLKTNTWCGKNYSN